jgi:hypothetical protein
MKTIFVMSIENTIDLITNSSSELFVLKGGTKEAIMQMLDYIDTAWRKEYEEPKNILELSIEELNTYFSYACSACMWPARKSDYPVLKGFTFDELYEEDGKDHAWNGEKQYKLINNKKSDCEWDRDFVTENNYTEIINKLNPNHDMWFLFSFDENPNWELQEQLMCVADRYHLG